MLQGTPEGQLLWICVNQSSAESIWCPDKLHPTVIRLHTSCIETCHLLCSPAHHQDLFKLRLSIHTSWEEREFSRLYFFFFFFHCLIWIWQIGEGGEGWWAGGVLGGGEQELHNAKKIFWLWKFLFHIPIWEHKRERHGPHCKKRTDEINVLCAGSSRVCQENPGLHKIWELTIHNETKKR